MCGMRQICQMRMEVLVEKGEKTWLAQSFRLYYVAVK